jgi:hypothetical protein
MQRTAGEGIEQPGCTWNSDLDVPSEANGSRLKWLLRHFLFKEEYAETPLSTFVSSYNWSYNEV